MKFNSEDMIRAAYSAIWNHPTLTEKEQALAREFFYQGALWAAEMLERMEE